MNLFNFSHAAYFSLLFFVSLSVTCPEPGADLISCQYYIVLIRIEHTKGAVFSCFFSGLKQFHPSKKVTDLKKYMENKTVSIFYLDSPHEHIYSINSF
jgi:hypothetical protein